MRLIQVRNVHEAYPWALQLLKEEGVRRDSRNGPVLMVPGGVTTVYKKPCERVVFWHQRDANPFFHLYEALWMLDGRNDVAGVARYVPRMADFSDDGRIFNAAYGYAWRYFFGQTDQLKIITARLRANREDRRSVLQMWNAFDLDSTSKDVACNLAATFQRDHEGRLDLVVFNRSNDTILGCYGANAVHFSVLLEFMASEIGCEVGTYTQVSVNWHAYLNKDYEKLQGIPLPNPYRAPGWDLYDRLSVVPMAGVTRADIHALLREADADYRGMTLSWDHPWCGMAQMVLKAHSLYRTLPAPDRYQAALSLLKVDAGIDWIIAAREWVDRRYGKWQEKNA